MSEGVILLHGIARTRRSMRPIEKSLQKSGYATLNLNYPSRSQHIGDIASHIHDAIKDFSTKHDRIHFVCHSMGGLVLRAYLKNHRPENLGRVVMLGTPNNGSEVADFLQDWRIYKWFFGPAGQQLVSNQQTISHLFGPVDYDVGIIAGNRPLDLISSLIIGKPNDGKVSVDSTKLPGMKAHLVLRTDHFSMLWNKHIMMQIAHFLKHGMYSSDDLIVAAFKQDRT